MATTKKTTTKKSAAKKTTPKDTGAMDEFVNTMVGVTLKEEDIVEKPQKPRVKNNPTEAPAEPEKYTCKNENEEYLCEKELEKLREDFKKRWEKLGLTAEVQYQIDKVVHGIFDQGEKLLNTECAPDLEEVKINRVTAVTDNMGNIVYYKVPADCEELQDPEIKEEVEKHLTKIIADDIYKKLNQEDTVKQEPVEVKPVDITPEVVAPKPVFPLRVVDKW